MHAYIHTYIHTHLPEAEVDSAETNDKTPAKKEKAAPSSSKKEPKESEKKDSKPGYYSCSYLT
jgi:hypothetical protein